jgi:hypothetical protein
MFGILTAIFFGTSTVAFLLVLRLLGKKAPDVERVLEDQSRGITIAPEGIQYNQWTEVPFGVIVLDNGNPIWKQTNGSWLRLGVGSNAWKEIGSQISTPGHFPMRSEFPKPHCLLLSNVPDDATLPHIVGVARKALGGPRS